MYILIELSTEEAKRIRKKIADRFGLLNPDSIPFHEIIIEKMNEEASSLLQEANWKYYKNNRELCCYYLIQNFQYRIALPYLYEFIYLFYVCQTPLDNSDFSQTQKDMFEKVGRETRVDFIKEFKSYLSTSPLHHRINANLNFICNKIADSWLIALIQEPQRHEPLGPEKIVGNESVKVVPKLSKASLNEIHCQQCDSLMKKSVISSGNFSGIAGALLVFLVGFLIVVFLFWTIVGLIIGLLLMLFSLGMGGKRSKVWKCPRCGFYFPRA